MGSLKFDEPWWEVDILEGLAPFFFFLINNLSFVPFLQVC